MVMAVTYWIGALTISIAMLFLVDRHARRLAPLGTLFRLSLAFPDQAPSRFRVAMRSGSVKKLERRIEQGEHLTADEAAPALLGLVAQVPATSTID